MRCDDQLTKGKRTLSAVLASVYMFCLRTQNSINTTNFLQIHGPVLITFKKNCTFPVCVNTLVKIPEQMATFTIIAFCRANSKSRTLYMS